MLSPMSTLFIPEVQQLLREYAVEPLPLVRAGLKPKTKVRLADAELLFPNARDAAAAKAGLTLQLGDWAGAHEIAQDVASREGSYWHAIIHRMEPDYANASYWFRRVGFHPIHEKLLVFAQNLLQERPIRGWRVESTWSAEGFTHWIQELIEQRDASKTTVAVALQVAEITDLMSYCAEAIVQ